MAESSLEFGKIHSGKKIDLMIEDSSDDSMKLDKGFYCRCSVYLGGTNTRVGVLIMNGIQGNPDTAKLVVNILSQY